MTNDEVRTPNTDTYHEHDPLPRSSVLIITNTRVNVKLPAHRAGLSGNEISFFIVPLDPAYKAGLVGHLPVKVQHWEFLKNWENELWAKVNVGKKNLDEGSVCLDFFYPSLYFIIHLIGISPFGKG